MRNPVAPRAVPVAHVALAKPLPGQNAVSTLSESVIRSPCPSLAAPNLFRLGSVSDKGARRNASRPTPPLWEAAVSEPPVSTTVKGAPTTTKHADGCHDCGRDQPHGSVRGLLCVLYVLVLCVLVLSVTAFLVANGQLPGKRSRPALLKVSSSRTSTEKQSRGTTEGSASSTAMEDEGDNERNVPKTAGIKEVTEKSATGLEKTVTTTPENYVGNATLNPSSRENSVYDDQDVEVTAA